MDILSSIKQVCSIERAQTSARFFKTGVGEYGHGDIFLGVTVPQCREIASRFSNLSLEQIKEHLHSKYHEERLIALLVLVEKYNLEHNKKEIFDFYLENSAWVNNWDLVDSSADKIVGRFLFDFGRDYEVYKLLLKKLAESSNIWERRIAIVSTYYFIKKKQFDETISISEMLLGDKHDLIHKAVGWMLREIGKRDVGVLEEFLRKHKNEMPRTALRYAIERFPEDKRKSYLKRD